MATLLETDARLKALAGRQVVMIDNYDSFTYNLVQYLQELELAVTIYRNDEVTVDHVLALKPLFVMLSPGPSAPDQAGICLDLVRRAAACKQPLLGVCLGHQAIGQAFGGQVVRAALPMHGKTSAIHHEGAGVFAGLTSPVNATRYHSLIIDRATCPAALAVTAWTEDGTIMGVRHQVLPIEGVQFHPESILTEHGRKMLATFAYSASIRR